MVIKLSVKLCRRLREDVRLVCVAPYAHAPSILSRMTEPGLGGGGDIGSRLVNRAYYADKALMQFKAFRGYYTK